MTRTELQSLKSHFTKKELFNLYHDQLLDDILRALGISLFDKQDIILRDLVKMLIIRSGRRTSKSLSTAIKAYTILYFGHLFDYQIRCVLGGPRAEDTRHAWRYLNVFYKKAPLYELGPEMIYNNFLSNSTQKKVWRFDEGSFVTTASCDAPEMNDVRGEGLDFVGIDEFGNVPYKEALLDAVMYSIKDEGPLNLAWLVGTHDVVGTGEKFNRLFDLGQEGHPDISSYKLIGSDNPYTSRKDANIARDIVTESGYLREELGEPVPAHGKLFEAFDIREHKEEILFNPAEPYDMGIDFGLNKPYACAFQIYEIGPNSEDIQIDVFWEFSPKQYTIDNFIITLKAFKNTTARGVFPQVLGCDRAGDHRNTNLTYTDFEKLKKVFPTAQHTSVVHLVSKANQVYLYKFLTMGKRIRVSSKCPRLLRFFAMATPDKNRLGAINSAGWAKVKGIDDPGDGFIYGLINDAKTAQLIKYEEEKEPLDVQSAMRIASQLQG